MIRRRAWRISLLLFAFILFAIPVITPLVELSGSHNHTCSTARCALCAVSGTLHGIAELSTALLFVLLPLIILYVRLAVYSLRAGNTHETPIALKTKILS